MEHAILEERKDQVHVKGSGPFAMACTLDGKIDKLAMQVKLLIILALVAITMFSPNLAELVRVAK